MAKLSVACNDGNKKRGQEVTCIVSTSTGTITAAFYQFIGTNGKSSSDNVPSSWQLTGPLLVSGTLVVIGQVDSVAALPDSITVTVANRSPNPIVLGTASGTSTCNFTVVQHMGWTAPSGTCDVGRWISPNPASDNSGINATCATTGINKGLCYVTSLSSKVDLGFGIAAELTGAGSFGVNASEWAAFGCPPGGTTTNLGPPNACGGGPGQPAGHKTLAQRAALTTAHELCHMTKSFAYASSAEAKDYLDLIEAVVAVSEASAKAAANLFLKDLDEEINQMNGDVVYAPGTTKWIWAKEGNDWGRLENAFIGGEAC